MTLTAGRGMQDRDFRIDLGHVGADVCTASSTRTMLDGRASITMRTSAL